MMTPATVARVGRSALVAMLAFLVGAAAGTWRARVQIEAARVAARDARLALAQGDKLIREAECAVAMVGPPTADYWRLRRAAAGRLPLRAECSMVAACAGVEGCR